MTLDHLQELAQKVIRRMESGDFEGALDLAYKIRTLGSDYHTSYIISGLLIDIGFGLGKEEIVKEGVELLQKDFESIVNREEYAPTAYYNFANGYYNLFCFKLMEDPNATFFRETELDLARAYYRKALEYDFQDVMLTSQIWVNLGNCFDTLGRVLDALECYEEALKWKPDHGMALGNKGIALSYYALVSGEHQATHLIEAYSLLSQALKLGVLPEAAETFSEYLEDIKKWFSDKETLDKPPEYPGYTIEAESEFERFLVEFCLKNKLFLNVCNFCQKCNAAIGDTAVIKKMIVPISQDIENKSPENNRYLRLSAYLNQIKQDYVSARFLLVLSRYQGLNLDFADKHVTIINTLDYTVYSIYIQLVKMSFKSFYNILDKIACFINDYLELGISEADVHFRNIWYSNWKKKKVRKKIEKTKNSSLNALFDIHRGFRKDGPYEKLHNTRNALTHRFVNVRMLQELEDEENMSEETLIKHALELARIVRSAIIYLLYFVYAEESKKERDLRITRD